MMTLEQNRERQTSIQASILRAALAALCIFLVLLVGGAHLLHTHPLDGPSEAGCSLCLVAHLAASPAPVVAGPVVTHELSALVTQDTVFSALRFASYSFYIRPPPAPIPYA